jgi:hypothetical protein
LLILPTKTKSPGVGTSRVTSYLPCDRVSMPPFCKRAWHGNHITKIILCEVRTPQNNFGGTDSKSVFQLHPLSRNSFPIRGTDDIFRFVGAEGRLFAFNTTLMLSAKFSQTRNSG